MVKVGLDKAGARGNLLEPGNVLYIDLDGLHGLKIH